MSIKSRSVSATSSSLVVLTLAIGGAFGPPAAAKVFMSQEEALKAAFGAEAVPEKRTAWLSDEQAERIRSLAGTPPPTRIVVSYAAGKGPAAATAYFDSHVVRTLPETIMVVVGPSGKATRVEILSFDEPEDYLPRRRWLDQLQDRPLDDRLSLRSDVRAVTGATLSSRALTEAVRRILATHAVLAAAPAVPEEHR